MDPCLFMDKEQTESRLGKTETDGLLDRIRLTGDSEAFERLCSLYGNLLESMVRRFAPSLGIGTDPGAVSDVLGIGYEELRQDAAMFLYKAARTYVPRETGKGADVSFGLYAKICIRNGMISQVRRYRSMKKRREAERQRAGKLAYRTDAAEGEILAEEAMRQIRGLLSPYEKAILPLYLAGKPPREIAALMGRTEKSVSNGIYRIKSKIRQKTDLR